MRSFAKKILSLVLTLSMLTLLAACGAQSAPVESAVPTVSEEAAAVPDNAQAEYDSTLPVNVMTLNGTTGFGMANLMYAAQNGGAALNYSFTVETDASNITAALINGSADIAALPTNAAAALYSKTGGAVQVLALNTLGVLYLVSDGTCAAASFDDLKGQTVYVPAQNPSFIFQYLCEKNGLKPGEDIIIDTTYAQPADLNAAVSSGEVSLAVLPEPMVTIACAANSALSVAMDLTAEWDKVSPAGSLGQGCVVVRTEFAKEHAAELKCFLDEYRASVEALSADVQGTAEKIQETGIFAKAAVAAKAIPNCNVCFIAGSDMRDALSSFYEIMFAVAPASIGGAIPGDDFYCVLE